MYNTIFQVLRPGWLFCKPKFSYYKCGISEILYIKYNFTKFINYIISDLSKEISFLCRSLGRDWKFFIRSLGLPEDEIETISCDYRTVRERIHQCLLAWQHQEQQGACQYKLIAALRHSSVQRNDLASKLEEGRYWFIVISGKIPFKIKL